MNFMVKEMYKRVALVLGGSGGIGRTVVAKLAQEGYAVGVHFSSSESKANELVEEILADKGHAIQQESCYLVQLQI